MKGNNPLASFGYQAQMEDVAKFLGKVANLEFNKEQELYFLERKEQRLEEELHALEVKEQNLLKEYEAMLIEMASRMKVIKELKNYAMEERGECVKRYMELRKESKDGSSEGEQSA